MEQQDKEVEEKRKIKAPGWVRPVSYVLIGLAVILTVFYDRVSGSLGVPSGVLQIGAIGCLILGAALFFSVRDKDTKVDRASAYREFFGRGGDKDDDVPPFKKGG